MSLFLKGFILFRRSSRKLFRRDGDNLPLSPASHDGLSIRLHAITRFRAGKSSF